MAQEDFFEGTKKGAGGTRVIMVVSKDEKQLFENIRKIKPAQWKELNSFVKEAKEIIESGGLVNFYKSQLNQMKDDIISSVLDPFMAPLLEAFAPLIAEFTEDIIPVIQDLTPLLKELSKGLADAITALKSIQIQLPGGSEWDPFWSGTLETLEKLVGSINDILNRLFGGLTADEKEALERFMEDLIERWGRFAETRAFF